MQAPRPLGRILTFYSYKGGTGRSMALANLAWILASGGRRVLVIDWDLEAPGLHRYFRPFLIDDDLTSSEGLVDMVDNYASHAILPVEPGAQPDPQWYIEYTDFTDYLLSVNFEHFPSGGKIDFLPAGRQSDAYSMMVSSFNWQNFYDRLGGGGFFEAIKAQARQDYDYILIDSRTGLSDTAGICSVQMPDTLVACFTYNNQSIKGAAAVARSAVKARAKLAETPVASTLEQPSRALQAAIADTAQPYRVFPVPMRVAPGESERLALRQAFARNAFAEFLGHLGPGEVAEYWSAVEIPHEVFYSYEEVLAPFKDNALDPKTVLAAFVRLARFVTDGDVTDYQLLLAPEVKQTFLDAFAATPLTQAKMRTAGPIPTESEEEALVRRAETALGRLDDGEKHGARRVLARLVRLGRPEEGGGCFPIRVPITDFDDVEHAVIARLASGGLVIVTSDARSPDGRPASQASSQSRLQMVGLADERLTKVWRRLLEWLDEDREFLLWRQQLRAYLADWERNLRDAGALLGGALLGEARSWLTKHPDDLNAAERAYVDASLASAAIREADSMRFGLSAERVTGGDIGQVPAPSHGPASPHAPPRRVGPRLVALVGTVGLLAIVIYGALSPQKFGSSVNSGLRPDSSRDGSHPAGDHDVTALIEQGGSALGSPDGRTAQPAFAADKLDAAMIHKEVRARIGAVKACYERALKRNPNLSGKVKVRWTITTAGTVSGVDIADDSVGDSEVSSCIRQLVARWRFPAPAGGSVEVEFPFVFTVSQDVLKKGDDSTPKDRPEAGLQIARINQRHQRGSWAAPVAAATAETDYLLLERKFKAFQAKPLRFTSDPRQVRKVFDAFIAEARHLEDEYAKISDYNDATWTLASLLRRGDIFCELALKVIKAADNPPDEVKRLSKKACKVDPTLCGVAETEYKDAIFQFVTPLEDEAKKQWKATLERASDLGVTNDYVRKARENLSKVGTSKGGSEEPRPKKVATAEVLPTLSQSDIVSAMRAVQPRVKDCYNQYKLPGIANVSISVAKGGRIASASVTGKFAGTPSGSCVEAAAKTAKFPPCEAMSFPWPFQLH